jgi:hypothetical protein
VQHDQLDRSGRVVEVGQGYDKDLGSARSRFPLACGEFKRGQGAA